MAKNKRFVMEYPLRTAARVLYDFLSTPHGLVQWFADHVNVLGDIYIFTWEGVEQRAKLVDFKTNEFVRYEWEDAKNGEYFEFKIQKNEITGDRALIITDFAIDADIVAQKQLWESQVNTLTSKIGG